MKNHGSKKITETLPIDTLPVTEQITFAEQELACYQAAYTVWNAWLQESKNKLRSNYDSMAGYVREKARQIEEIQAKLYELKQMQEIDNCLCNVPGLSAIRDVFKTFIENSGYKNTPVLKTGFTLYQFLNNTVIPGKERFRVMITSNDIPAGTGEIKVKYRDGSGEEILVMTLKKDRT